ncbi:carboxypeptidase-like regulatory domain-containing protein [Hymenobacter sp. GOD-10R]|jgi:hypothetical protein|uniref:carboxypeptidase-like regulatory domain-containing protein n=1 Tax=Hymenobacter sp. GOD-10R TaxID=3093922 RepID=UPI002D77B85E|nr:carboxypeptidase-like regulatory domain-containing protein [Hymenobacter sp. GOD-10R]WRQ28974.1 carboxypeptidase-like regulatory domain-containing protein [Hymenobacter sp. GOD-10R]
MKLTASPFDPTTGELLPVYRDAYLRGDLARTQTKAVDEYLRRNSQQGTDALHRLHNMATEGEAVRPVGWVNRQIDLMRTEPERFRRRAASIVAGAALVGGTVFAGTNLPKSNLPFEHAAMTEAASSLRMVAVRGRILNEEGKPLVGATVLHKGSSRGVSTNANGEYVLFVPAGASKTTSLQYGYGGYVEEEVPVATAAASKAHNVTLVPQTEQAKKHRRWLFF